MKKSACQRLNISRIGLCIIGLLGALAPISNASAVTIAPYSSFTLVFDGLHRWTTDDWLPPMITEAMVFWRPAFGEEFPMTVDLYEDASDTTPILSTGPNSPQPGHLWGGFGTSNPQLWNDLEGKVVWTLGGGYFSIDTVLIYVVSENHLYTAEFDVRVVPLPASSFLLLGALSVFLRLRRR